MILPFINIPENVTSIGEYAFFSCQALTSLSLPQGIEVLNKGLFFQCYNLETVNFSKNLKTICGSVFHMCSNLKELRFPKSIISIDARAFSDCPRLYSIEVENENEFYSTVDGVLFNKQMTKIIKFPSGHPSSTYEIPENIEIIGQVCFAQSTLKNIKIPSSVKLIEEFAFQGCGSLSTVDIPNGVTTIEKYAFSNCSSMSTLKIGNNVNNIGDYCFIYCMELIDVYCFRQVCPTTQINIFQNCNIEYTKLHVPATSVDAYKVKAPWSSFKEVVALTDQELSVDAIMKDNVTELDSYTIGGQRTNNKTKGLNIVRMSDGTTKKVVIR